MVFHVAEPTLSPQVAKLLQSLLGCEVASEGVLADKKQFDFFLIVNGYKIIVELKIGGLQKLPGAIAQAEEYKEKIGAAGVIVIVYPEEARKDVTKPEDVALIASNMHPSVTVLCPFLKEYYPKISLAELAINIKESLAKPKVAPSVSLVVETLRQSVTGIALEIKHNAGIDSPIIKETVGSLILFEILSEEGADTNTKEEAVKDVVADLAAYILINQLLLHHILANLLSLPKPLAHVNAPVELNSYFKEITDIDYKAVYCIDIASNIPTSATLEINTIILAIRAIEPQNLRHDLLGRIFHEFLPFATRKRLGTFYTRPQAAEILAGLAIDRVDEKVLDPACGSGTLLVAAYRKKKFSGKGRPHKKLVEEEITGVDIMPFAAHLAALNLTMQSPMEPTNKTRVGIGNALHLIKGSEVDSLTQWMQTFGGEVTGADVEEPLTKGEAFKLEPVDVVIMNPPFTRKESLTPQMKGMGLSLFGEQNYWAYFIALADTLLKKHGKIAAVLPRDFFKGQYSRIVREYLFKDNRYFLKYVVKTTKDWAFSENALFRDYLIVIQKGGTGVKSAFIYLKKGVSEISIGQSAGIPITVKSTEEGKNFEDESIAISWKNQTEVSSNYGDLGYLVTFNTSSGDKLLEFYRNCIYKAGDKLVSAAKSLKPNFEVIRGFEHGGENLQSFLFVVRPINKKRVTRSALIIASEDDEKTVAMTKTGKTIKIPREFLKPGLRTSAYVPSMDIHDYRDYFISKPVAEFNDFLMLSGIKELDFPAVLRKANKRFTHLILNRRFDLTAPGTSLLSFYSEDKALPVGLHWSIMLDRSNSKALCVWLNSIFYVIELLLSNTETRGSFMIITEESVKNLHIPNFMNADVTPLLEAFDKTRHFAFPPIVQQFENPPEARRIIDRAVLKVVGYSDKEADVLLSDIYQAMAIELKSWHELMHESSTEKSQPSLQMHLLPNQ